MINLAQSFYQKRWPNNLCSIVLVYFSGCLVAITYLIETDSNILFRPWHYFVGAAILVSACNPALHKRIADEYRRDWGALLLVIFCLYFLIQAVSYPFPEVSSAYTKIFFSRIGAGLALGFFAIYIVHENQNEERRSYYFGLDTFALGAAITAMVWISWRLGMRARADIFLIQVNPGALSFYQTFGDYLLPWYFCMVVLLRRSRLFSRSFRSDAVRYAILLCLAIWLVFLAQLVGSNNAAVCIAAIGALMAGWDVLKSLFWERGWKAWLRCGTLTGEGLIAGVIAVALVVSLPPMRIFSFNQVGFVEAGASNAEPTLSVASSSFASRSEIYNKVGNQQLLVNPLFGDLGAEIITGSPGNYIHSLLSIQTHTGVVGSILLLGFLVSRIITLVRFRRHLDFVTLAFVGVTIGAASIATFFTWLPFWFAAGLLLAFPIDRLDSRLMKCGASPLTYSRSENVGRV